MMGSAGADHLAGASVFVRMSGLSLRASPARHGNRFTQFVLILALAIPLLGGCAVKLAPDYQKEIVDGLASANQKALTLFAAVSGAPKAAGSGAPKVPDCSKRADTYASVIGEFEAVAVQIKARPVPQPVILIQKDRSEVQLAPSLPAVNSIVKIFTRMRGRDETCGVEPTLVQLYKSEYEGHINDALVYEKALER